MFEKCRRGDRLGIKAVALGKKNKRKNLTFQLCEKIENFFVFMLDFNLEFDHLI